MIWRIGLACLLTAGFAKLSVMLINVVLSRPKPKWLTRLIELIQLLVCACFAGMLFTQLTTESNRTDWPDLLLTFPLIPSLLGYLGLILLLRSAIIFQCHRSPACESSADIHIIDVRNVAGGDWKQSLVGPGPMRRVALLPGNEQFLLEVATRTYVLPRLPREWDGLSIVQISDTHYRGAVSRAYFEFVCQKARELNPDLFVFTGDLLDDIAHLNWLPETIGALRAPLGQFFILGNHDWYLEVDQIRSEFERHGWTSLSGTRTEIRRPEFNSSLEMAGDETPWIGTHPVWATSGRDQFRILLSHTPDNIEWARRAKVDLMLSGHTHGGQIRLPLIGPLFSPSRYGCQFASGVFWLEPTLLHVSRGLSGREPIRYLCRPELTKLILRSPATDSVLD